MTVPDYPCCLPFHDVGKRVQWRNGDRRWLHGVVVEHDEAARMLRVALDNGDIDPVDIVIPCAGVTQCVSEKGSGGWLGRR